MTPPRNFAALALAFSLSSLVKHGLAAKSDSTALVAKLFPAYLKFDSCANYFSFLGLNSAASRLPTPGDMQLVNKIFDSFNLNNARDKQGQPLVVSALDRYRREFLATPLNPMERSLLQNLSDHIDRGFVLRWVPDLRAPDVSRKEIRLGVTMDLKVVTTRQAILHEAYHFFSFERSPFATDAAVSMFGNDLATMVLNEVEANFAALGDHERAWAVTSVLYQAPVDELIKIRLGEDFRSLGAEEKMKVLREAATAEMLHWAAVLKGAERNYGHLFRREIEERMRPFGEAALGYYDQWLNEAAKQKVSPVHPVEIALVGFDSGVRAIQEIALRNLYSEAKERPAETLREIFRIKTETHIQTDNRFIARALHLFPSELVFKELFRSDRLLSDKGEVFLKYALAEFREPSKVYLKANIKTRPTKAERENNTRMRALLDYLNSQESQLERDLFSP